MRSLIVVGSVVVLFILALWQPQRPPIHINRGRAFEGFLLSQSGCKVWTAFAVDGEIARWTGTCDDLKFASGPGRLDLLQPNGDMIATYVGNLQAGAMDGHGSWRSPGLSYDGSYEYGRRSGAGKETRDGNRYVGNFRSDRKFGRGTMEWANGDFYRGFWMNDLPDGYGQAAFGSEFVEGQWRKGCLLDSERVIAMGQDRVVCEGMEAGLTAYSVEELTELDIKARPQLAPGGCRPPKGFEGEWSSYLLCD